MKRRTLIDFLVPGLVLVIMTLLLGLTKADLWIESFFYKPGSGWVYAHDQPWKVLYRYGALPGLMIGVSALITYLASFFYDRIHRYRKMALYFLLLLALGPGLVIPVFKSFWGRPRPRQMESFGGARTYQPVWQKGVAGEGRSFPSGHASIAFYVMAPFFVLRRSFRKWALVSLALGLFYGALMGIARMVQGGHFMSDVLWSGGFVYLMGLLLFYVLHMDEERQHAEDVTGT